VQIGFILWGIFAILFILGLAGISLQFCPSPLLSSDGSPLCAGFHSHPPRTSMKGAVSLPKFEHLY
jgi:hypothetical protein